MSEYYIGHDGTLQPGSEVEHLRSQCHALAAKLAEARRLIDEHNAGCVEACEEQLEHHCKPYRGRGLRCPDCPRDWMIETPDKEDV